jgi:hypothetical protein
VVKDPFDLCKPQIGGFNIPAEALPLLQTQLTVYEVAFTAVQAPNHGKVNVLTKNEARDMLKSSIRVFVKAYLAYNPAVSDADRENMGLPLHGGVRTPVPVPATIPELELDSSDIRQITVHFKDVKSGKRGKPAHVHGVELRWELPEAAPSSVDCLKSSVFDKASPYTFNSKTPIAARPSTSAPAGKTTKVAKAPGVKSTKRSCRKYGGAAASHIPSDRWYMRRKGRV